MKNIFLISISQALKKRGETMKKLKALVVSAMCLTLLGGYVTNYSARESLTRRYSEMYTRTLGTS